MTNCHYFTIMMFQNIDVFNHSDEIFIIAMNCQPSNDFSSQGWIFIIWYIFIKEIDFHHSHEFYQRDPFSAQWVLSQTSTFIRMTNFHHKVWNLFECGIFITMMNFLSADFFKKNLKIISLSNCGNLNKILIVSRNLIFIKLYSNLGLRP